MPNPLIGTWKLYHWKHIKADGSVYYPFGERYRGYLIYTVEGYVSATLMKKERRLFDKDGLFAGSPAEKEAAFETYVSNVGTYRIEKGAVIHKIKCSLFPNWIGTEQTRYFEIKNDELILTTADFETKAGDIERAMMVWKKCTTVANLFES